MRDFNEFRRFFEEAHSKAIDNRNEEFAKRLLAAQELTAQGASDHEVLIGLIAELSKSSYAESISFTMTALEKYHEWLTTNPELTPIQ